MRIPAVDTPYSMRHDMLSIDSEGYQLLQAMELTWEQTAEQTLHTTPLSMWYVRRLGSLASCWWRQSRARASLRWLASQSAMGWALSFECGPANTWYGRWYLFHVQLLRMRLHEL